MANNYYRTLKAVSNTMDKKIYDNNLTLKKDNQLNLDWGIGHVTAERITVSGLTVTGMIDLTKIGNGTLDDIGDGSTYQRVLSTQIQAGYIKLSDQTIFDSSFTTDLIHEGGVNTYFTGKTLDDIGEGISYKRILTSQTSEFFPGKIRLASEGFVLDENGAYCGGVTNRLDLTSSGIRGYYNGELQVHLNAETGSLEAGIEADVPSVVIDKQGITIQSDLQDKVSFRDDGGTLAATLGLNLLPGTFSIVTYYDEHLLLAAGGSGDIVIWGPSEECKLMSYKPLNIQERSSYQELVSAGGFGQFWVKNDTPCTPWFTDDAGNSFELVTVSGIVGSVNDNDIQAGAGFGINLIPSSDKAFNIGSPTKSWKLVYASGVVVESSNFYLDIDDGYLCYIGSDSASDVHVLPTSTNAGQYLGYPGYIWGKVYTKEVYAHGEDLTLRVKSGGHIIAGYGALEAPVLRPNLDGSQNLGHVDYRWDEVHAVTYYGDGSNLTNVGDTLYDHSIVAGSGFFINILPGIAADIGAVGNAWSHVYTGQVVGASNLYIMVNNGSDITIGDSGKSNDIVPYNSDQNLGSTSKIWSKALLYDIDIYDSATNAGSIGADGTDFTIQSKNSRALKLISASTIKTTGNIEPQGGETLGTTTKLWGNIYGTSFKAYAAVGSPVLTVGVVGGNAYLQSEGAYDLSIKGGTADVIWFDSNLKPAGSEKCGTSDAPWSEVHADVYYGDGSLLTGVTAGSIDANDINAGTGFEISVIPSLAYSVHLGSASSRWQNIYYESDLNCYSITGTLKGVIEYVSSSDWFIVAAKNNADLALTAHSNLIYASGHLISAKSNSFDLGTYTLPWRKSFSNYSTVYYGMAIGDWGATIPTYALDIYDTTDSVYSRIRTAKVNGVAGTYYVNDAISWFTGVAISDDYVVMSNSIYVITADTSSIRIGQSGTHTNLYPTNVGTQNLGNSAGNYWSSVAAEFFDVMDSDSTTHRGRISGTNSVGLNITSYSYDIRLLPGSYTVSCAGNFVANGTRTLGTASMYWSEGYITTGNITTLNTTTANVITTNTYRLYLPFTSNARLRIPVGNNMYG